MIKPQIANFVKSCQVCAQTKLDSSSTTAPLRYITANEPLAFWAMDYMGPLPETSRGNKHLVVVMDHFKKCVKSPLQRIRKLTQLPTF